MARIRSIKPEFWSDEKLSECSLNSRLLFIGLISFADDEGRLDYSPARLRMQIFPCGSAKLGTLTDWIGELSERSLIRIYTVDSREYLEIPNFTKHQKINRPTPSKIPPFSDGSLKAHGVLSESSPMEGSGLDHGRDHGMEGRGGEGSATKSLAASPAPPAGLNPDAWDRWAIYRSSIKKPIKAPSLELAQKQLAAHGGNQDAVVDQSIANGWTGLFDLKSNGNGNHKPAGRRAKSVQELEAEEAASNAKH